MNKANVHRKSTQIIHCAGSKEKKKRNI